MNDPLESFLTLISARVHQHGTLMALVGASTARRVELRPKHPGAALEWCDREDAIKLVRSAAQDGNHIALVSDGIRAANGEWRALTEKEVRFFRPQVDPASGEIQLNQSSRLHASMVLTRLQMRHLLPHEFISFGPHRGYQQLYLPPPFI